MNLLTIIFLVVLVLEIISGYKRGMVRQVLSFISLIFLSIIVFLGLNGMHNYVNGRILSVLVTIIVLGILLIVKSLISFVFLPAKIVTKLPLVNWVDKLLGIVAGALETVAIFWILYCLVMVMGLGMFGQQILAWTQGSSILAEVYRHNLLMSFLYGLGIG